MIHLCETVSALGEEDNSYQSSSYQSADYSAYAYGHNDGGHTTHLEHEAHGLQKAVLALFTILVLGAASRHFCRTFEVPVPYTVVLLLLGGIIGFMLNEDWWEGTMKDSLETLERMDPHLVRARPPP